MWTAPFRRVSALALFHFAQRIYQDDCQKREVCNLLGNYNAVIFVLISFSYDYRRKLLSHEDIFYCR